MISLGSAPTAVDYAWFCAFILGKNAKVIANDSQYSECAPYNIHEKTYIYKKRHSVGRCPNVASARIGGRTSHRNRRPKWRTILGDLYVNNARHM
tara:strand:+ start:11707 stop:11991 length:285 start_codon:yes stop_codon:yes gene_type:complete